MFLRETNYLNCFFRFSELKGFDRVECQRKLERFVIDLDG